MKRALQAIIPLTCVLVAQGGGRSRGIFNGKEEIEKQYLFQQQQDQQETIVMQQQPINDVCGLDVEENHVGKLYLEFNGGPPDNPWTDDDLLLLQSFLAEAYDEASSCEEGYRSLRSIEIDPDSFTSSSEFSTQFRVPVNVMMTCRGCSDDLRFFSHADVGRSQGRRFLGEEGILGQRQKGMFGNNRGGDDENERGQELFLQPCRCPPPSRDNVLNGLKSRIVSRQSDGELEIIPELASIGAYFTGLQTRQSGTMKQRISRPRQTNTTEDKNADMTCPTQPPFEAPYDLPDITTFQSLTTCPFFMHELVLGEPVGTCFLVYDIPHWYSRYSVSFMLQQLKVGSTLFFEKESEFASWDDLIDIIELDDYIPSKTCIRNLDLSAVGVKGEISGEAGSAKASFVVVTFKENDKERYILIPIGGCEDAVYGTLQADKQRDLDDYVSATEISTECEIKDGESSNACLKQCKIDATSQYQLKLEELENHRDEKLSINYSNEKAVMDKLFLTRAADMVLGFAKCQCSESATDLEECLLDAFVDALATETDQWFEALEIFGQHRQGAERQYIDHKQLACDAANADKIDCEQQC